MIIFVFKVFEFEHFKKLKKQRNYFSASSEISSKSGIDALRGEITL